MKPDLDHPCKLTCSGWQQGYDRGCADYDAKLRIAVDILEWYANEDNYEDYPDPSQMADSAQGALKKIGEK